MPHILAALSLAVGSWIALPGGTWDPIATDVAPAQAQLESYIRQQAAAQGERLPAWSSYTFQYQGQMLDGRKVILVNGFCSASPASAASQLVIVLDGGACYFRAYWDIATRRYAGMQFNGHA